MHLTYRNPVKMAERRQRTLDRLASTDRLLGTLGGLIVDRCAPNPPTVTAPSIAMLDYFTHKRRQLRADAYRLRYGRDYWTGRPRRDRAAAALAARYAADA